MAVLTDPERVSKVGISSPYLIPHTAICDPELTLGCPPALTASAGADALSHVIEAFTAVRRPVTAALATERVFVGKNELTDTYALLGVRLIAGSLQRAWSSPDDMQAREAIMLGATAGGFALGTAGTAAAHAIQYPVGAVTHTPHGIGVGALLPYVMEFNRPARVPELAAIALAMGASRDASLEDLADQAIDRVAALLASVATPATLAELGLPHDKLRWTAEQAMGAERLVANNPRPLDVDALERIVRATTPATGRPCGRLVPSRPHRASSRRRMPDDRHGRGPPPGRRRDRGAHRFCWWLATGTRSERATARGLRPGDGRRARVGRGRRPARRRGGRGRGSRSFGRVGGDVSPLPGRRPDACLRAHARAERRSWPCSSASRTARRWPMRSPRPATRRSSSAGSPKRRCACRRLPARAGRRQAHRRHAAADRRRAADHPVELPRGHGDPQARAGAGRRVHDHPQARARDAADRAYVVDVLRRAGVPDGVVNLVTTVPTGPNRRAHDSATRPCGSCRSPARPRWVASCCTPVPTPS